jgi:hypothetical protein
LGGNLASEVFAVWALGPGPWTFTRNIERRSEHGVLLRFLGVADDLGSGIGRVGFEVRLVDKVDGVLGLFGE